MGWHLKDYDAIVKELGSSRDGLSIEEARRRLVEYGPNLLK